MLINIMPTHSILTSPKVSNILKFKNIYFYFVSPADVTMGLSSVMLEVIISDF